MLFLNSTHALPILSVDQEAERIFSTDVPILLEGLRELAKDYLNPDLLEKESSSKDVSIDKSTRNTVYFHFSNVEQCKESLVKTMESVDATLFGFSKEGWLDLVNRVKPEDKPYAGKMMDLSFVSKKNGPEVKISGKLAIASLTHQDGAVFYGLETKKDQYQLSAATFSEGSIEVASTWIHTETKEKKQIKACQIELYSEIVIQRKIESKSITGVPSVSSTTDVIKKQESPPKTDVKIEGCQATGTDTSWLLILSSIYWVTDRRRYKQ